MKFVFRISGGITCWDPVENSDIGGPSSVTFRMETYSLFNTDIVNFVLKTDEGEAESIDFCSLAVLEASVDEEW